jgi:hypothetical protein
VLLAPLSPLSNIGDADGLRLRWVLFCGQS